MAKLKGTKYDVVISGGGIAGLALAIKLAQNNITCAIIDPAFPSELPKPSSRTAAVMKDGIAFLKSLGIWEGIAPHASALKIMRIVNGGQSLNFDATEINLPEFGFNIPILPLRYALWRALQKTDAQCLTGTIDTYDVGKNSVTITVQGGDTIQASLLVGADGRNSAVRRAAGIGMEKYPYGRSAITTLLTHTKPHRNASIERHSAGGPFTTVPMPDSAGAYHSSLVWVEKEGDTETLLRLPKNEFLSRLQAKAGNDLGTIMDFTPPESWPLCRCLANRLVETRVALVAEAAHALHPIGAQGLNLSLRDIETLAALLTEHKSLGLDIGSQTLLNAYGAARTPDMHARGGFSHTLHFAATTEFSLFQKLKDLGFEALNTAPPLRKTAMQSYL